MHRSSIRRRLIEIAACLLITATAGAAGPALSSGIDRSMIDSGVRPGQDFFQYVNGRWNAQNPIPPEYTRWGSFPKLRDDNAIALRKILDALLAEQGQLDPERQKLRDFYRSAMDEQRIQQLGASPLNGEMQRIAKINSRQELVAALAHFRAAGLGAVLSLSVGPDARQSTHYAVQLRQGGLGLPERDYYVGASDDSRRIRRLYREHIARMLTLLGDQPQAADASAAAVLKIETRLAEASRTPVQLRDREANYNKKTRAQLSALAPELDWDLYLKTLDLADAPDVIVGQPEFFQRVNEMLTSVPPADWRAYLRWQVVNASAAYLSDPFVNEDFRFYGQTLRGAKELQPRWKRAIQLLDHEMGEALGRLYVEKYFPPAAKQRMDELVKNLLAAYRQRIETRDWMGPATKQQALAKLAAIMTKIGYPDHWRDYTALQISPDSLLDNVRRARAFESHYRLGRLGKPVDRSEWHMTPPTVNAYYNSTMNEIVFPAGILQPPFFDLSADDAVNYGAIGAVIGHEITHGFDDQGSRSDAHGNLHNWWTPEDRKRFDAKASELVKQYDACVAVDDLHVNGRLTLGENLADLGGVTIAYAAYQKSLGGRPAPVIDGFTGAQRFFIGYARVWAGSARDAEQRVLLRTDPHSPPRFRTLIPLSNIQAFYDAFDVKPGDAMYRAPADRVQVW